MITGSLHVGAAATCHSWNGDRTALAVCPNSSEIHIYRVDETADASTSYSLTHVLTEHDQLVTGLDWSVKSNQVVSCAQDRNAYVWSLVNEAWQPEIVITRLSRAALCVKWSPCETKFALGSSAKVVCVCYRDEVNNWWSAKLIKDCHSSSVLGVAWHPSSALLATVSTDKTCRVFGADIAGGTFGQCLLEVASGAGWALSVAWNPSGTQLAFSTQGSTVVFVSLDAASSKTGFSQPATSQHIKLRQLPVCCLSFLSDSQLAAAGFDGTVLIFRQSQPAWALERVLTGATSIDQKTSGARTLKSQLEAFQNCQGLVNKQLAVSGKPMHSNCVVDLQVFKNNRGNPRAGYFSTLGLEGTIINWTAENLSESIAALHL